LRGSCPSQKIIVLCFEAVLLLRIGVPNGKFEVRGRFSEWASRSALIAFVILIL
jgi:hypothetical protein